MTPTEALAAAMEACGVSLGQRSRYAAILAALDGYTLELVGPKSWLVTLTCCGRADGVYAAATNEEAQRFREAYLSGPGVKGGHVGDTGHDRSAVITSGLDPRPGYTLVPVGLVDDVRLLLDRIDYVNGPDGTDIVRRIRAAIDALARTEPERDLTLATALLDAVEEAIGSEALPGNIHHRLTEAYNSVVKEANRA